MTDKELIETAAKAAGLVIDKSETNGGGRGNTGFDLLGNTVLDWHNHITWNPLTDDGDALRLAVKLFLWHPIKYGHRHVDSDHDIYAATRRVITTAAAEIGRGMKEDHK